MLRNLPNILTASRIIVIPVLVASFYAGGKLAHWLAAGLFLFASVTDFFDGYLARMWSVQSNLGRFLDPIADKLLVATAIIMLVRFGGIGKYDVIAAVAILCREILVSGLREYLAELREALPVSKLGKIKTAVQMTALFLLLLGNEGSGLWITEPLGRIALWIAAILTLVSGYAYLKAGMKHISE
jgi:CDP-diacylglycerol--glycerol-3-phosphate 3-phosphatidyltransferase